MLRVDLTASKISFVVKIRELISLKFSTFKNTVGISINTDGKEWWLNTVQI
jgi:hypothetical protein